MSYNDITLIIKEKLSILNIISSKIRVIKKGNSYIALCPFHIEKTPSLYINETKGLFHCFGCGESGDIFKFIMLYNKLTFREALEFLAGLAGVSLEKKTRDSKVIFNSQKKSFYKTSFDILNLSANWFYEQLFLPENKFALQYLFDRGFSEYTIKAFKLGYAPSDEDKLLNSLLNKGFNKEDLIKVGLRSINNNKDYNVFKNRIIFPIKNKSGKTIAFGGRGLNNEIPKYLNSKDSELFHKKLNLYGLNEIISSFKKLNYIILVEGYLDVLALYQHNFPAVAPLGTAVSIEQLNILVNLNIPLYICLDGDTAGQKASFKVANLILEILNVETVPKFIILPNSEDPDSFLKKHTKEDFLTLINQAISLSDFLWQEAICDIDFTIPESKALLQKKLTVYLNKVKNRNLRDVFSRYFETKLHNSFSKLFFKAYLNNNKNNFNNNTYSFLNKNQNSQRIPVSISNGNLLKKAMQNNILLREYLLLAYVISCPQIYSDIEKEFALLNFSDKELDELKQAIVLILEKNILDSEKIKLELDKDGYNTILNKVMNLFLIKKTINKLKTPEDFLNAFYDIYNRILFNSLKNDIEDVKEVVLKDIENPNESITKAINRLRCLNNELQKTKVFKGKL